MRSSTSRIVLFASTLTLCGLLFSPLMAQPPEQSPPVAEAKPPAAEAGEAGELEAQGERELVVAAYDHTPDSHRALLGVIDYPKCTVLMDLKADEFVKKSEQILLIVLAFFIMLGMGASLTPRDFFSALRRPAGLAIGWVTQFGIMPLLAFTMVFLTYRYIQCPPEVIAYVGLGAILMGSVPGGTTSNIFTYFSKGNLALSVMMTTNSTIWALIMTPLALFIYAQTLFAGNVLVMDGATMDAIIIPFGQIIGTIGVMLVPVFLAMAIRRYNANVGAVLELFGGVLGVFFTIFLIVTWVPRNWTMLTTMPWPVYLITIGLGFFGITIAYTIAKLIRLHPKNARTVALETGIQNGPLAIAVALLSYQGNSEIMSLVLIIPASYTLFIVFVSFFATMYFRRANLSDEQKIPSLL